MEPWTFRSGAPKGELRERLSTVLHALLGFLHGIRTLGNCVFELDRRRKLPLVLLDELEDFFDRRLAGSPGQIQRAVLGQRPVFQVEARDAVMELVEEIERRAALVAAGNE